jgi:hypothetical protein
MPHQIIFVSGFLAHMRSLDRVLMRWWRVMNPLAVRSLLPWPETEKWLLAAGCYVLLYGACGDDLAGRRSRLSSNNEGTPRSMLTRSGRGK